MKKSVTATVLACALVVGGVGLTPAGASESGATYVTQFRLIKAVSWRLIPGRK